MIICICNNVNSKTINDAIEMGADTVTAVREATTATACCGKCQFKVNRLIQNHGTTTDKTQPALAAHI